MKKKSTIKSLCIAAALSISSMAGYAATITATVSGNWSSASTWSGGTPGSSISIDNIVIPSGITVNMDMSVQFTSLLSSMNVAGSLTSTGTNSLTINSLSTLSGNGSLNLSYLELGSTGAMTFSGNATIHHFVTSATSLNLASQVTLMDTLHLKAGSLSLGAGSNLMLNSNSNIKVEDGTLAIGGGLFTGSNSYNVLYVGSTKTAGVEMSGTGFNDFKVQLSSSSQSLTLASNTTVNGMLSHTMGNLVLNGKTLTIKGGYSSSSNGGISGSSTSNLVIQTSAALSSSLMFNSGSRSLNNLELNIASGGNANLASDLAINGDLRLTNGKLNMVNTTTLTMNAGSNIIIDNGGIVQNTASFNGSASYNVNYMGASKTSSVELTGTGLNNVMLQMTNATDSVKIGSNTTIKGMLNLNKGSLHMNGKTLTLQGSFSSTSNGWLRSNTASNLMINTTGNLGDTLMFASGMNRLNNLTVNIGNSTNAMLGSDLYVETITLTSGGITIMNNDLTVNATGSISGYTTSKYIQMNGTGSLVMNVNSPAAYVMYPIGTSTSMAPAYVQRNTGSGMIGVSTRNGVWTMGTSGNNNASTESIVDRTWDLKSVSGSSVDVNVKFEWTTAMEVNGFDRTNAYISHYSNSVWDLQATSTASVMGSGRYQLTRSNITSFSPFAVVDKNAEVGIEENQLASATMYPNPATDRLTVTVPNGNNFNIEVYDGIGNLVLSKAVTDENSKYIDLTPLHSGIYFVKVSNSNTQSVKRIVKQ
jgi:hypothetical protein